MINFGHDKFNASDKIIWDSLKVVNGHFMIVGGSGTGKTYTIREILRKLAANNSNFQAHVIDVHGDIDIGEDLTSEVKFSETANYGLNPLKVSDDLDFGGVRKKIRSFISMLNRTSRALGSKQESVLMHMLTDLYNANGFYAEDPKSWSLSHDTRSYKKFPKKYPTLTDLGKFANFKWKQMLAGTGSKAISSLEKLNKKANQLEGTLRKIGKNHPESEEAIRLREKLQQLKEECTELYTEYVNNIETGREMDDMMKYNSADVVQSVFEKITNVESTGIFKSTPPNFDNNKPVHRYNVKSLNKDEQKMFVDILLEDIYLAAKEKGEQKGVNTFIIIDEAHIFISKEDEHIINVISKEARKFGVGLILASQSFNHFSEDIIANSATKLVLGIDEMYHDVASKKLKVEVKRFKYITPHKSMLIQIKNKGNLSNKFYDCVF